MTSASKVPDLDNDEERMPVRPSGGRPTGDEHWTRKIRKEVQDLQSEVNLLKRFVADKGFDVSDALQGTATGQSSQGTSGSGGNGGEDTNKDNADEQDEDPDDSEPEDGGDDPFESQCFITLYAKMNFSCVNLVVASNLTIFVNPKWKMKTFTTMLSGQVKISPNCLRLMNVKGETLYCSLSYEDNMVRDFDTISVSMELKGGARTTKKPMFVKKEDALKHLKDKLEATHKVNASTEIDQEMSETFHALVNELKLKQHEFETLRTRIGQNFITICLRHLDTESLSVLKTLFTNVPGTKNLTNDERAARAVQVLFPTVKLVQKYVSVLQSIESETTTALLHMFVDEFHNFNAQAGILNIDGQSFLEKVKQELSSRNDRQPADLNVDAVSSNCILQ
ncbi:unnamed protein product [Effrenium voratum]|uniref:Uncharacterized protein n=1 Tax=Effrenium voratum TaxID=2562239 RepID=A0AA36JK37_9DINO|nr:unnamed protein product [Effrenium voratum]